MSRPDRSPSDEVSAPSPQEGGPAEAFVYERASATPVQAGATPAVTEAPKGPVASPVAGPLNAVQSFFAAIITHPTSAIAGVDAALKQAAPSGVQTLEQVLTAGPQLCATDRVSLYHYAYHARLVECLVDDYPAVQVALGHDVFEQLARRYIEQHPSTGPNLNWFGRAFAAFCPRQAAWLPQHRFASDLARLEWAMVEVIHSATAAPISMDALSGLPPEALADIRLEPSHSLRVLEFEYRVNPFMQATRRGETPEIPLPQWSATAVYRQGFRVWRMDLTRPMAGVLSALMAGETLGDALATLPDGVEENAVMRWFREWVQGGFFARVRLPGS